MCQTGSRKCAADGTDIDQLHYLNAECPLWVLIYISMSCTYSERSALSVQKATYKWLHKCTIRGMNNNNLWTNFQTHTYIHAHHFNHNFPVKHGLSSYPLDSQSPVIFILSILTAEAETFHSFCTAATGNKDDITDTRTVLCRPAENWNVFM